MSSSYVLKSEVLFFDFCDKQFSYEGPRPYTVCVYIVLYYSPLLPHLLPLWVNALFSSCVFRICRLWIVTSDFVVLKCIIHIHFLRLFLITCLWTADVEAEGGRGLDGHTRIYSTHTNTRLKVFTSSSITPVHGMAMSCNKCLTCCKLIDVVMSYFSLKQTCYSHWLQSITSVVLQKSYYNRQH